MLRKLVGAILVVLATTGASTVLTPGIAHAADSWVYLVVRKSACGNPQAYPRAILGNVQPSGWTSTNWDAGDDIIYPRVRLNVKNTANLQVRCDVKSGGRWIPAGYATINYNNTFTPTGLKQTFWVG